MSTPAASSRRTRPDGGRPGFTVPELLIAAALGAFVVGFGIQHTYEYFRLQGTLMAKTELRHATQQVQDRVGQKLRYALNVVPMADNQYLLVIPLDVDRCGYVCHLDRYELLWWEVKADPMTPDRGYLAEKRILTPAFEMPGNIKDLTKLFDVFVGEGRRVATAVEGLEIGVEAPGLYRTKVVVARIVPRQKEPARLAFTELIAARSKPRMQGVPKFDSLFVSDGHGGLRYVPGGKRV